MPKLSSQIAKKYHVCGKFFVLHNNSGLQYAQKFAKKWCTKMAQHFAQKNKVISWKP